MENKNEVTYSTIINGNPDEQTEKLIDQYWLFEDGSFKTRPGKLAKSYGISLYELLRIINEYSYIEITKKCSHCDTEITIEANSQSKFKQELLHESFCSSCLAAKDQEDLVEDQTNIKYNEVIEQNKELINKLDEAVELFESNQLSYAEIKFMLQFIEMCPERISISYYTKHAFDLQRFNLLNLIHVDVNMAEEYVSVFYSEKLQNALKNYLNNFSYKPSNSNFWTRMSFKLIKNKYHKNNKSPLFLGSFIIEEDMFIRKGTKCFYRVWSNENNNGWMVLSPITDFVISENKSIEKEPEHIRNLIYRFLRREK
tara:strand:- start:2279 stop:3217 length:939 start_codon:yes stop_codon:yes gene_type:complete